MELPSQTKSNLKGKLFWLDHLVADLVKEEGTETGYAPSWFLRDLAIAWAKKKKFNESEQCITGMEKQVDKKLEHLSSVVSNDETRLAVCSEACASGVWDQERVTSTVLQSLSGLMLLPERASPFANKHDSSFFQSGYSHLGELCRVYLKRIEQRVGKRVDVSASLRDYMRAKPQEDFIYELFEDQPDRIRELLPPERFAELDRAITEYDGKNGIRVISKVVYAWLKFQYEYDDRLSRFVFEHTFGNFLRKKILAGKAQIDKETALAFFGWGKVVDEKWSLSMGESIPEPKIFYLRFFSRLVGKGAVWFDPNELAERDMSRLFSDRRHYNSRENYLLTLSRLALVGCPIDNRLAQPLLWNMSKEWSPDYFAKNPWREPKEKGDMKLSEEVRGVIFQNAAKARHKRFNALLGAVLDEQEQMAFFQLIPTEDKDDVLVDLKLGQSDSFATLSSGREYRPEEQDYERVIQSELMKDFNQLIDDVGKKSDQGRQKRTLKSLSDILYGLSYANVEPILDDVWKKVQQNADSNYTIYHRLLYAGLEHKGGVKDFIDRIDHLILNPETPDSVANAFIKKLTQIIIMQEGGPDFAHLAQLIRRRSEMTQVELPSIKSMYHDLARMFHPSSGFDKKGGKGDEEAMKEAANLYELARGKFKRKGEFLPADPEPLMDFWFRHIGRLRKKQKRQVVTTDDGANDNGGVYGLLSEPELAKA